jgi:hypothetical protein
MFKVGDRVAVIHLHRVGKDRKREAIRIDTVEKVTLKQITTNKRNSTPKVDFKSDGPRPNTRLSTQRTARPVKAWRLFYQSASATVCWDCFLRWCRGVRRRKTRALQFGQNCFQRRRFPAPQRGNSRQFLWHSRLRYYQRSGSRLGPGRTWGQRVSRNFRFSRLECVLPLSRSPLN